MYAFLVIYAPTPIETTYRHVGRFEGNLDSLLSACEQSVYTGFHGHPEAKQLLITGLSNILAQVRDWLQNICNTIDNPLEAYQNNSYELEDGAAVFSFNLKLEAPAEFSELSRLAQSLSQRQTSNSGIGFWNSISSIILGFAFVDWLFDDD